ncbi:CRISPR-associated protein Csx16 [Halomonas sp. LS-001]
MTDYVVSRHSGALQWLARQGIKVDKHITHLDDEPLNPGDRVIGTLPLQLACQVCEQGAEYWHLSLDIPAIWRGQELSDEQMDACNARLEAFHVQRLAKSRLMSKAN